jgi:two-component sensor histidine kinase
MRDAPEVSRFASEFRIRRADNGEIRWIASRGEYVRDAAGRAVLVRGTNHDITDRKRAEERQTLLAREVDHRAKNALAVVQSVLKLTPRDDADAYARAVEGRIAALARVQTLLAEERWTSADLRTLLRGELAPFQGAGQRVSLEGPPVALPPRMAQPLAMTAHELATNAVKHGALSVPGGSVSVVWQADGGTEEILRLRWEESGGPALNGPPGRRGFGTRMLDGTVRSQLGGAVSLDWRQCGLVCELVIPFRNARPRLRPAGNGTVGR